MFANVKDAANGTKDFNFSSSACQDVYQYLSMPSYMQAIMILMYSAICVLAIGGNIIVCYIILGYQRMHTTTNYFIVNLAVGDVMVAALCIPFDFVANQLLNYWPFGAMMCPIMSYCQAAFVFLSSYTMVAISLDRFHAIIYPLRPRMTACQAKMVIGLVWLIALSITMPIAIVSEPNKCKFVDGVWRERCKESWNPPEARVIYSWALMILQYFLPLLVLTVTYSVITYNLWGKRPPGEAEDSRDQRLERSKRKVL